MRIGIALVMLVLSGCATAGTKLAKISVGMDKDHVIEQLGTPDSWKARSDVEVLEYMMYANRDDASLAIQTPYGVMFKDGQVVQYGRMDELFPPSSEEIQARRERAAMAMQMMQGFRATQPVSAPQSTFTPMQPYQMQVPMQSAPKQTHCTTSRLGNTLHTNCY